MDALANRNNQHFRRCCGLPYASSSGLRYGYSHSMDLLLGQLVYASFTGMGFRTVASVQVPTEIQQAFIQRVVYQHWDSYKPPQSGYRAVYLLQVTLEQSLFGWLYNDGTDDVGRNHVPYFICYYLAQPLYAFPLENIFNFLHKGPVALIDRHSRPATLETMILPDLWSYQSVRPGVLVPWGVRLRSQLALEQRELIDLFVPLDGQENEKTDDALLLDVYRLFEQVKLRRFLLSNQTAEAIAHRPLGLLSNDEFNHWIIDIQFEATPAQTELILRNIKKLQSLLILNLQSNLTPALPDPKGRQALSPAMVSTFFRLHVFSPRHQQEVSVYTGQPIPGQTRL